MRATRGKLVSRFSLRMYLACRFGAQKSAVPKRLANCAGNAAKLRSKRNGIITVQMQHTTGIGIADSPEQGGCGALIRGHWLQQAVAGAHVQAWGGAMDRDRNNSGGLALGHVQPRMPQKAPDKVRAYGNCRAPARAVGRHWKIVLTFGQWVAVARQFTSIPNCVETVAIPVAWIVRGERTISMSGELCGDVRRRPLCDAADGKSKRFQVHFSSVTVKLRRGRLSQVFKLFRRLCRSPKRPSILAKRTRWPSRELILDWPVTLG